MPPHDADHPVTAHVRISVGTEEDLARIKTMVAEIVGYDRPSGMSTRSVDALVTPEQLQRLQDAAYAIEQIAPVWSKDQVRRQVSQENRYAARLASLKGHRPKE